jgi:hypothetical protein
VNISQQQVSDLISELYRDLYGDLKPVWGIHPWFTVRVEASYLLLLLQKNADGLKHYQTPAVKKQSWFSNAVSLLRTRLSVLRFNVRHRVYDWKLDALCVGHKENESIMAGAVTNPYLHPAHDRIRQLGYTSEVLYLDDFSTPADSKLKSYFKLLYRYHSQMFDFWNPETDAIDFNVSLIGEWWERRNLGKRDLIETRLRYCFLENQIYFKVLREIFRIVRPKMIWAYCFYNNRIAAASRACNDIGINMVEYQHSQQSDDHFAYRAWENIDAIRNIFPRTFWLWRESDRKRIDRNFAGKNFHPNAVAAGNLLLAGHRSQRLHSNVKKSVLVSLQGFWIPDFIEEFIRSESSFKWYFRLHPRYPDDREKLNELKRVCGDRIKVDEANNIPLYELMDAVSTNITGYSGVAVEAHTLGIRNIIFGDQGLRAFRNYIDSGVFYFVHDLESFQKALHSVSQTSVFDPILTEQKTIDENLKAMLR